HSRESQEQLQAAAPNPRGPGEGLLRGHSRDPGGGGRIVLRGDDARHRTVERRPRAPDATLQVFRLPDGMVAGAGPSATRRPAPPPHASAPHPARGSVYICSLTLPPRTPRRTVVVN